MHDFSRVSQGDLNWIREDLPRRRQKKKCTKYPNCLLFPCLALRNQSERQAIKL